MRGLRVFLGKSLTKLMPIIFARCLAGSSWFRINFCSAVLEFFGLFA